MRQLSILGKKIVVNNQSNKKFWDEVEQKNWEQDTFRIFKKFIKKDSSYIDIGAWIGPTALFGAHLAKKVYAVEPDPVAYSELINNIELNNNLKDRIVAFYGCIGNSNGKVKIGNPFSVGSSSSSLLFCDSEASWEVESMTIDTFVQKYEIDDCSFIKMDIEGGEFYVLKSMKNYLRKKRPTLHLSIHGPFLYKEFPNLEKILKHVILLKAVRGALCILFRLIKYLEIYRSIKMYRYMYNTSGRRLNLFNLLLLIHQFPSLLLTDRKWE
jgi:FkbM family methyltransferase